MRDHEPHLALDAGADGLSIIRRLLTDAGAYLKPGGYLLFEIGFDQSAAVQALDCTTRRSRFMETSRHLRRLAGFPQVASLVRTVALEEALL